MNGPEPTPREIERRIDRLEQYVNDELANIHREIGKIDAKYVTNERFSPVERIVMGLVVLILIAVAGAIIGNVVIGGK